MTLHVAVVVGNPKPQSRTLRVATTLVGHLLEPDSYELQVVDLADHQNELFDWPSATMAALNASVAESDLVIFASPTYKATYTGLLKAFLDRYPANGLDGVVAIPVLTGANASHSMGPTYTLAPLLVELGATVPGRGLYFITSQMDHLKEIADAAASGYRADLARLARLSIHARPATLEVSAK
ncbi:NAD(P)H-dependent oxidoreductase [Microbacterium trichothecenolyticum]|uniref:NADPH-dependent FMN reductase n=1 Tax=Microbacterium trichothecenolyticum TaxID=69370 RepID=UPI001C6EAA7A|nr:NAD(P)H-dependent oxidoreductase [Microbacterium trichothecenolyticum]MBW9122076.1 NAD(P)H-dependent oxidoreductase [Microbacterium trichothecenolyticum]